MLYAQKVIKSSKGVIRDFLKEFPQGRLLGLLAHAQDGKLAYFSCCCLAGSINADHPLQGQWAPKYGPIRSKFMPGTYRAENLLDTHYRMAAHTVDVAYANLGIPPDCGRNFRLRGRSKEDDARRRARIIPMIKSELRRRERARLVRQAERAASKAKIASRLTSDVTVLQ